MEILVLQHEDNEDPGLIFDWAAAHDIDLKVMRPDLGDNLTPINANDLDGVILLGGPQNVDDDHTWLAAERILIRSMDKIGRPVFGICLGAQQIVRAFGTPVLPMPLPELGRGTVARPDGSELAVFQWHMMGMGQLPGATIRYTNQAVTNQGFSYHHRIMGVQFHLEFTPKQQAAMIAHSEFADLPALNEMEQIQAVTELNGLLDEVFL